MNKEITDLRRFIWEAESGLASAKNRLAAIETACRHAWGETKQITVPRVEIRDGEMIKRGSDFWYQPVPYTVHDPAWERTCNICGKKETTKRTEDVIAKKPVF